MDLESSIYDAIKNLAPPTLPLLSIKALTNSVIELLQNKHSVTSANIRSIIYKYEQSIPLDPSNQKRWATIDKLISEIITLESDEEIIHYLLNNNFNYNNLMLSPMHDHTLLNNRAKTFLNGNEMLENIDTFNSPTVSPRAHGRSFNRFDSQLNDGRSIISSSSFNIPSPSHHTVNDVLDSLKENTISEEEILSSVFYTLLGSSSKLFPFNTDENFITIPSNIPNGQSDLLHSIFEAALLYCDLSNSIKKYDIHIILPLKKALLINIQNYLKDYSAFVNELSNSWGDGLTLFTLYSQLYERIFELRIYSNLLKKFEIFSGYQYLVYLHSLKLNGNILIAKLANKMYSDLSSIYFAYVVDWLVWGKLDSSFQDFFIEFDENLISKNKLPLIISEAKILSFIPNKVWYQILIIGKSYLFIKKYCDELRWQNNFSNKYASIYDNLKVDTFSKSFFTQVENQYKEIVDFSNNILIRKFHLADTISVINDILLMGCSDFTFSLMYQLQDILSKSSSYLQNTPLNSALSNSVWGSSLKYWIADPKKNNTILNPLDARIINLSQGSLGWDVFALDYSISPPLSIVLNVNNEEGKKEYLRIFTFLWKFKRLDFLNDNSSSDSLDLVRSWKKLKSRSPVCRDIYRKIIKVQILKKKIHAVCLTAEQYCFTNIIEKNYKDLISKLNLKSNEKNGTNLPIKKHRSGVLYLNGILKPKSKRVNEKDIVLQATDHSSLNIDQIHHIHGNFLNNILSHKLLLTNSKANTGKYTKRSYSTSLNLLLNKAFDFVTIYSSFLDISQNTLVQVSLDRSSFKTSLESFNSSLNSIVELYKEFEHLSNLLANDLDQDETEELKLLGSSISLKA